MEGLGQLVSLVQPAAQTAAPLWQKLLTGGMFGAGELGNILEERKRAAYQNYVMSLLKDPAKLSRMAVATEKPLDNALVQSVGNTVQGQMAERGLAQAPGIYSANLSQALAPYAQQNYNTALKAILQTLGMPPQTFQNPSDQSGALRMFLNTFGSKGSSDNTGGAGGGFVFPSGTVPDLFPTAPTFDPSSDTGFGAQ